MKLTILRIENKIVNCQLDDKQLLILPRDSLLKIFRKGNAIELIVYDKNKSL